MYYRAARDRAETSDVFPIPENYSGSVFRTSGGKRTFTPLEEQVTPVLSENERISSAEPSAGDLSVGSEAVTETDTWQEPETVQEESVSSGAVSGEAEPVGLFRRETQGRQSSGEACRPSRSSLHFGLPKTIGAEELLLVGLMYLTADSKHGDGLWLYLLILLFCGE